MTDVVISGRITNELMDEIKKLGKTNTEILNEALGLYISKITTKEPRIPFVYKKTRSYDINTIHEYIDGIKPINVDSLGVSECF